MLKSITLCTIQIGDIISLYQLGTVDLKWQSNFGKLFKDTLSETVSLQVSNIARGHALEFSVKSTIPVSRVKVAVHTYATGLFKIENYSEFDVSLSIHYYKNIYFGTGSVILYIWPFWGRYIRQSCGNCLIIVYHLQTQMWLNLALEP